MQISIIISAYTAVECHDAEFYCTSFVPFALAGIFGGTGLLIVIGVAIDLIQKVEGHMVSRNFSAMLKSDRAEAGV